jgi:hypothetical protein
MWEAEKAKEEFNAWHAPEAVVEILAAKGDRVSIKVTGTACKACGFDEYVFDYAYLLSELVGEVSVESIADEPDGLRAELGVKREARPKPPA